MSRDVTKSSPSNVDYEYSLESTSTKSKSSISVGRKYSSQDTELFSVKAESLSSSRKFAIEQRSNKFSSSRQDCIENNEDDGLVIPKARPHNTKARSREKIIPYPKSSPYYKTDNPVLTTRSIVMPCMTEKVTSSPPLFSPDEEVAVSISFTSSFFDSSQFTPSFLRTSKES